MTHTAPLTRLKSATIYDPHQQINGVVGDIYFQGDRIVAAPADESLVRREIDLTGQIVMAGAIDLHTHIGGGKLAIARTLLPDFRTEKAVPKLPLDRFFPSSDSLPTAHEIGRKYAQMGYTVAIEPAVLPYGARQSHLEMADIPNLDTGGYAMLGNEPLLLQMISDNVPQQQVNDLMAWTLASTQCLGIKVVNAGGIDAFKFDVRKLDVDGRHPRYGVRPRDIIGRLTQAIEDLGVPHPLHVHASNLGVAGNVESTLATIDAAEGRRIHVTHIQFNSYGDSGSLGFSSGAAQVVQALEKYPNLSIDVGQIVFGQTVTISADNMSQFRKRHLAKPNKWALQDIECSAGCGVVPMKYEHHNFVNALQWTIGLEILLSAPDLSRVFLTTDHPNGGPFTSYPHLIRLLMDRSYRESILDTLNPDAVAASSLRGIDRELSLYEIAQLTRSAPAAILGLGDHGHLSPGALADIVAYQLTGDMQSTFERPTMVIRRGEEIVRGGELVAWTKGKTQTIRPHFDPEIRHQIKPYFAKYMTMQPESLEIRDEEMENLIGSSIDIHPCLHDRHN